MLGFEFRLDECAFPFALRWDHELQDLSCKDGYICKHIDVVVGPFRKRVSVNLTMKDARNLSTKRKGVTHDPHPQNSVPDRAPR